MPTFSRISRRRLATCHPKLQELCEAVVQAYDCTVLTGHRTELQQREAYRLKRSKVQWPEGKHNSVPSLAVDLAPHPIDWDDTTRFYHFAGYVQGIAAAKDIPLRWGGDWDRDFDLRDQTFMDLCHFELGALPPPPPGSTPARPGVIPPRVMDDIMRPLR